MWPLWWGWVPLVVLTLWPHCATSSLLVWDHMFERGTMVRYSMWRCGGQGFIEDTCWWNDATGRAESPHGFTPHSPSLSTQSGLTPWTALASRSWARQVCVVNAYLLFFNVSKSVWKVNGAAKKKGLLFSQSRSSEDFSPLSGRGVSCVSGFIRNRSYFPHWLWTHSKVCIGTQSNVKQYK